MVDGTTIYFPDPPPKINEAPSLDNTTPEAISPTVSLARAAQPTDYGQEKEAPEIESSVREDPDQTVETEGTAALSDNPGAAPPTTNNREQVSNDNIELTDPASLVEAVQTASPVVSEESPPDVQLDKQSKPSVQPSGVEEDKEFENYYEDDEDDDDDEYTEELTEEQKGKLQETINKLKTGDGESDELLSQGEKVEDPARSEGNVPDFSGEKEELKINNEKVDISLESLQAEEQQSEDVKVTETTVEEVMVNSQEVASPELVEETQKESIEVLPDPVEVNELNPEAPVTELNQEEEIHQEKLTEDRTEAQVELPDVNQPQPKDHQEEPSVPTDHIKVDEPSSDQHLHGDVHHDEHYDHGHSHDHGHGHSHDHGHSHSHGLDHLGQRVVERVPESIPDYYQPAEQKFDVPLSQQFSSSPSPDQTTTPSTFETNYEDVHTPAFQTTTPASVVQSNNEAGEIETSMNEVAAEEPPVAEGLFSSFTKIFSSTTVPSSRIIFPKKKTIIGTTNHHHQKRPSPPPWFQARAPA